MEFERINPITNQPASKTKAMTVKEAAATADHAAQGFITWSAMGPSARRAVLMKAAQALESRKDEFVAAMMAEIGATAGWAMFNLMLATGMVREAAALTTQIGGEVIPSDKPGCMALALREPVGTILGIAPWNAPIILGVRAIAVPLACGNSVILKASEICPRTHSLIIEAFAEAGADLVLIDLTSKGVPGKNAMPIAGKPCAQWTIEHALASQTQGDGLANTGASPGHQGNFVSQS